MKRVPLRRTVALHSGPQRDPVTHVVHDAVLRRDKECVAAKLGFLHVCRDRWGVPHAPYALPVLTVEHVHEGYGMAGERAKSDVAHLVTLCAGLNLRPPSRDMRTAFRAYLAEVNP